jgi:CheY-like chemotaxis protein
MLCMPQGNVLIVEDDDSVRHLLVDYLKQTSATHVDSARDGADALHHVHVRSYDVIILDVMMPHMTGIDFLDSLQVLSSDRTVNTLRPQPAVIVITSASAEHLPNDRLEERSPGMVRAVLRKPLELHHLQSWLDRLGLSR